MKHARASASSRERPRRISGTLSTQTDAQGRFSLHGTDEIAGEVEVMARSTDSLSKPIWVPVGSDDVHLALVQLGSLSGSVRLADPSIPTPVSLRLRARDGSRNSLWAFIPSRQITPDAPTAGFFLFQKVTPGIYDLARTIHEPGPPVRSRSAQDVAALAHGTYILSHRARTARALAATILERAVVREMV